MSEHFFGLHQGHLTADVNKIAERHDAWHVNYVEPGTGKRRGWFGCRNLGHPFDRATAEAVLADIDAAGGMDRFLYKRDREKLLHGGTDRGRV